MFAPRERYPRGTTTPERGYPLPEPDLRFPRVRIPYPREGRCVCPGDDGGGTLNPPDFPDFPDFPVPILNKRKSGDIYSANPSASNGGELISAATLLGEYLGNIMK